MQLAKFAKTTPKTSRTVKCVFANVLLLSTSSTSLLFVLVCFYWIDRDFNINRENLGNEKDTDEAADTVGCCSLRCEHVTLHDKLDDQK